MKKATPRREPDGARSQGGFAYRERPSLDAVQHPTLDALAERNALTRRFSCTICANRREDNNPLQNQQLGPPAPNPTGQPDLTSVPNEAAR
jgi:hypothetical protein